MSDEPLAFSPDQFGGLARVFPLPKLVMFPHVMQALHIFEPRYRAMLEEALADDRLIVMATVASELEPADLPTRPPLEPVACLCRIATHQLTPQGTYNVLLIGVRRVRLGRELPALRPFRVIEAEILDEMEPEITGGEALQLQRDLLQAFKRTMPKLPDAQLQLDELLGSQVSLGMLTDIVAYTLDLDPELKLRLLAECDVLRRTRLLLEGLAARGGRRFPPPFSRN
ncbi:MAG: ATP-dependent protease [Planctomycetota bacterium]|nr:MAG: ATP-dependent protease [Planctomycetota bacterium]